MAYRMNSPKGRVQHAFDTQGKEAATAQAKKDDVPESKLNRWFREWGEEQVRTERVKARKDSVSLPDVGFNPDWRFSSQQKAETEARVRAEMLGMDTRVFVVIGPNDEGKWSFAPCGVAHNFGAEKVVRTFKDGDRVYGLTTPTKLGKVVKTGPEVCEVKWDMGATENVPIYYIDHAKRAPKIKGRAELKPGSKESTQRIGDGLNLELDKARKVVAAGKSNVTAGKKLRVTKKAAEADDVETKRFRDIATSKAKGKATLAPRLPANARRK